MKWSGSGFAIALPPPHLLNAEQPGQAPTSSYFG